MKNEQLIEELINYYELNGNKKVRAYYTVKNENRYYYDFQNLNDCKLKGSFLVMEVTKVIFHINNQA